ncbi:serine/threonine kinase [Caballeronia fortuita]|uniref:Serine/threonine kinase n=1 Tax=Caballeronia fortuita TaxID=1777138 RepID=A0A158DA04_9BURK|nr:SUMF1/EgtB/PvdO family nonheme iron enzyme [Caballeronia fortuita]SAK91190.1 serine/threonine kinase [Caballeronia fortuita]
MWRTLLIAGMFLTIGQTFAAANAAPATSPPPLSNPTIAHVSARHALVIGNADYVDHPLASASRDADDMSAALGALGFDVTRRTNLDEQGMRQTLDAFTARLGPNDTALVYFAGHGLQAGGDALLVPLGLIDAKETRPATLLRGALSAREIVVRMTRARPGAANIVVLDMCLTEPFEKTNARSPALPPRTLVAYAAAPGDAAIEGARNGRYTAALLRALRAHSMMTPAAFAAAASDVAMASHGAQRPWIASTLDARFAIADAATNARIADATAIDSAESANVVRTRGILPKDSNEQYELTFWDSIKDSTYPSDYEAYLKAYPNGRFAALAKARIERLRAAGNAKPAASAPPAATATPATPAPKPPAAPAASATAAAEKPRPSPPPAPVAATPAAPPAAALTTKPAAKTASGGELKDCPACPVLIPLSAGSFTMGSNNDDPAEKPPHRVSVGRAFAIGKYEVTVEQWNACVDAGACTKIAPEGESATPSSGSAPMRNVSWDDAQVYVKWLSKVGGKPYRLPTEAEWEYAARGGTQSTYWWGDQMKKGTADCKDCGDPYKAEGPVPVGSFAANPYGLYDMNGSVWEWVADCWHSSYKNAPADGRAWDDPSCSVRVIRGGSWREGAAYMQSATRFKYSSSVRQSQNGFRVARDME